MTINQARAIYKFIKRVEKKKWPVEQIVFALANEFNVDAAASQEHKLAHPDMPIF